MDDTKVIRPLAEKLAYLDSLVEKLSPEKISKALDDRPRLARLYTDLASQMENLKGLGSLESERLINILTGIHMYLSARGELKNQNVLEDVIIISDVDTYLLLKPGSQRKNHPAPAGMIPSYLDDSKVYPDIYKKYAGKIVICPALLDVIATLDTLIGIEEASHLFHLKDPDFAKAYRNSKTMGIFMSIYDYRHEARHKSADRMIAFRAINMDVADPHFDNGNGELTAEREKVRDIQVGHHDLTILEIIGFEEKAEWAKAMGQDAVAEDMQAKATEARRVIEEYSDSFEAW